MEKFGESKDVNQQEQKVPNKVVGEAISEIWYENAMPQSIADLTRRINEVAQTKSISAARLEEAMQEVHDNWSREDDLD